MPEFENHTIEFETANHAEEEVVISGPQVACVGWIPFYDDVSEMPSCDYKSHSLAKSVFRPSALSILFRSGNPSDSGSDSNPSPASFSDRTQFLKFLESKNYRAALALDDVKLIATKAGRPLRVSFKSPEAVGFTPIRVMFGSHIYTYYDRGEGGDDWEFTVNADKGEVTIRYTVRFKLGKLGQFGCFLLTGRPAPSALMSIHYRISSSGQVSVGFSGSYVPSQSYYINWTRENMHDMIGNSAEAINGFLDAGGCKDAQTKYFLERNL